MFVYTMSIIVLVGVFIALAGILMNEDDMAATGVAVGFVIGAIMSIVNVIAYLS